MHHHYHLHRNILKNRRHHVRHLSHRYLLPQFQSQTYQLRKVTSYSRWSSRCIQMTRHKVLKKMVVCHRHRHFVSAVVIKVLHHRFIYHNHQDVVSQHRTNAQEVTSRRNKNRRNKVSKKQRAQAGALYFKAKNFIHTYAYFQVVYLLERAKLSKTTKRLRATQ